ncbi:MAG TPA: hypothetical protein VFV81_00510, partial [Verrucomicrobiae bacterium]|nr:hypothetical protein [Verrucomicrobiae bacterium]
AYGGLTVSNVTAFGAKILLATGGSGSYHDLYEQSALSPDSRWGDYSTTAVDPADPNNFWTIQLVPLADGSTWITHITELTVSPQLPSLTISVVGETAIVSWPTWADGFQLQANGDLGVAGAWATVPQSPVMNGSTWSVTVPATATKQFFRLLK